MPSCVKVSETHGGLTTLTRMPRGASSAAARTKASTPALTRLMAPLPGAGARLRMPLVPVAPMSISFMACPLAPIGAAGIQCRRRRVPFGSPWLLARGRSPTTGNGLWRIPLSLAPFIHMNQADLPFSAAAERNQGPILDVLSRVLPESASVLKIAAGTGQHAAHFAAAHPGWTWQPTEADDA